MYFCAPKIETERLKFQKPERYHNKVLIGSWFESQSSYAKGSHSFDTNYMHDYKPKPYSANDPALIWNQRIKASGYSARIVYDHQGTAFHENKSTTYDLAFNHLPKRLDGPVPRRFRFRFQRYEPEQDYGRNYGNITKYGLQDYYEEKWKQDISDPRTTLTTCYQDTFVAPPKKNLVFKHQDIPIPNSEIMVPNNSKLNDQGINQMSEDARMVVYDPHKPRCNPITWECPDGCDDTPKRCVL